MKKILFALNRELYEKFFSEKDLARIKRVCEVINNDVPVLADEKFLLENIHSANIVVSSWGTPCFDADIISRAEGFGLLSHAGGSVKPHVSGALWGKGIKVTSAAAAIAYGVAEFCLGQTLTATKRVFWAGLGMRRGEWKESTQAFNGPQEIYQQKIGIIGAGYVGRHLIKLLNNFTCDILLYDPFCTEEEALGMGATKVETLDEIFSQCMVVSLNAPDNDSTRGMIRGKHFELLPDGAMFINTARAGIINEEEFLRELIKGRFIACIDVTAIEPTPLDHPFRSLPNVLPTPHIAGVIAQNMLRIGTFVADEVEAFVDGNPLHFEITKDQLDKIA